MADSYDKRAEGWNPFNLQPLQWEASPASVILHRQAVEGEAETEVTGGKGGFSQAREHTALKLITPISTSLTSLNNCSTSRNTRTGVLHTGRLYIHAFKSKSFFMACKCIFMVLIENQTILFKVCYFSVQGNPFLLRREWRVILVSDII